MTGAITGRTGTGTGGTGDRTLGWSSSSDVEVLSFVIVSRSGEDEDDRRDKRRQQAEARRLDQEHRGEARRAAGDSINIVIRIKYDKIIQFLLCGRSVSLIQV